MKWMTLVTIDMTSLCYIIASWKFMLQCFRFPSAYILG